MFRLICTYVARLLVNGTIKFSYDEAQIKLNCFFWQSSAKEMHAKSHMLNIYAFTYDIRNCKHIMIYAVYDNDDIHGKMRKTL